MAQHLYLMQNCHGLIKIGRGADPERRRRTLESEEMCRIEIVAIQEDWGKFEEEIHIEMDDFRVLGEWFCGDDFTREIALIHFGLPPDTVWPFAYDEEAAEARLARLGGWRSLRSSRKFITDTILELKRAEAGSRNLDFQVWYAMWSVARSKDWRVIGDNKSGVDFVHRYDGSKPEPLPPYTTDVAAALTLWPDDERPARWLRSASDCCIAALRAELEKLGAQYQEARRGS